MLKLYDDNGYLILQNILDLNLPFNFVVGGRGTGKTYGALRYVIENDVKFILMRRTQSQVDLINKPEFCPFKTLNNDFGWNIGTQAISKYNVGFYRMEDVNGKQVASGSPLGYSVALSTISNLRGFDASDVNLLIYDEFIPERHERPIKEEGAAFLNAYETINRNRELKGLKPLQVVCLANANDLGNPIFTELKLISKAEHMRRKGQEVSINNDKGIGLFILQGSPVSKAKKNTALYKLTEDSEFEQMALDNSFSELNERNIKSCNLAEFRPIVSVGEICIYKHKSNGTYYCSGHKSGSPVSFGTSETELERYFRGYSWLWDTFMKNKIYFEDSTCMVLFTKYLS